VRGRLIGQHDAAVAYFDLGMANFSARRVKAHQFTRPESL
jgi:hypothetical protein